MPDENLSRLVEHLLLVQLPGENSDNVQSRVEARCREIRREFRRRSIDAQMLEWNACGAMARQTVSAALIADPDKFRSALGGARVDLELFDVSLLSRGELEAWNPHHTQHLSWYFGGNERLKLRGPHEMLHTVEVNVHARQFALSVADEGPDLSDHRDVSSNVFQLLGNPNSRTLEGDLSKRVGAMRSRLEHLSCELMVSDYEQSRTLAVQALDHPAHLEAASRIARLKAEIVRVERNARALEQAGRQLQEMWCEHGCWPAGEKAYKAAARLALVGHLMGETPVLSCLSGNDFTRRLDAEVKILATVADSQDGRLPPVELDMEEWQSTRDVLGR